MRGEEYILTVTALISDPKAAAEVQKELRVHLDEAVTELTAQGIEAETAEMVAVARMGSPESLAMQLAEAHHRHLPWRHYLAIIPLAVLAVMSFIWRAPAEVWVEGRWWLLLLIFCLVPDRATLAKWSRLIQIDARAKWHWLQRQPLHSASIVGGVSGGIAGLAWAVVPLFLRGIPAGAVPLLFLASVVPALVTARVMRRLHQAPPLVTAGCASLTFPLGFLPGMLLWPRIPGDWPLMVGLFAILFTLVALSIGWAAQFLQRKGWLPRT